MHGRARRPQKRGNSFQKSYVQLPSTQSHYFICGSSVETQLTLFMTEVQKFILNQQRANYGISFFLSLFLSLLFLTRVYAIYVCVCVCVHSYIYIQMCVQCKHLQTEWLLCLKSWMCADILCWASIAPTCVSAQVFSLMASDPFRSPSEELSWITESHRTSASKCCAQPQSAHMEQLGCAEETFGSGRHRIKLLVQLGPCKGITA